MEYKTPEERIARIENLKAEGFARFLDQPLAKLVISMIPGTDQHPDLLQQVLRAAFETGFDAGSGSIAGEMLEAMMTRDRPGRR